MRRQRSSDDAGETLVELLVAIMIMGITVVAVVGGLATSIMTSGVGRQQAQAAAHLRTYTSNVEAGIATSGYQNCAGTGTYTAASPGGGYSAEIVAVRYWNAGAWATSCTTDSGIQRLTLRVWNDGYHVDERVDIIIRRP